jgi:hypothetical protein
VRYRLELAHGLSEDRTQRARLLVHDPPARGDLARVL